MQLAVSSWAQLFASLGLSPVTSHRLMIDHILGVNRCPGSAELQYDSGIWGVLHHAVLGGHPALHSTGGQEASSVILHPVVARQLMQVVVCLVRQLIFMLTACTAKGRPKNCHLQCGCMHTMTSAESSSEGANRNVL